MLLQRFSPCLIVLASSLSLGSQSRVYLPYQDRSKPIDDRVADLLSRMSLSEKLGQMTQVDRVAIKTNQEDVKTFALGSILSGGGQYPDPNTPPAWADMVDEFQKWALATPLHIPLIYGVDAVHGHAAMIGATVFPHNIGLGATRDPDLARRIGEATAIETKASGVHWDFAPMLGIPQDFRWGRTYEGYGENTDLVSSMGNAYLKGLQGSDHGAFDQVWSVLATPKHFIGDGTAQWGTSPFGKDHIDRGISHINEAELRTKYLPPYIEAIASGARSIMVSFSSWGGLKMHEQKYLLSDVLKGELGFSGFLVSDWGALDELPGTRIEQITRSINAGLDMVMLPRDYQGFLSDFHTAVESGSIPIARIDDAVSRILRVKFAIGLFEQPWAERSLQAQIRRSEHRQLAREAVSKSLVVLKNEDQTLPINPLKGPILLLGADADNLGIQSGGWTIDWQGRDGNYYPGTTILAALEAELRDHHQLIYDPFSQESRDTKAALAIVVIGERPYAEWFGDRADLRLGSDAKQLIQRAKTQAERVLVILFSGRPMIVSEELDLADAFIAAWLPGGEGAGVTDALFGKVPFQGRLPYSWPRSMTYYEKKDKGLPETADTILFPYGYHVAVPFVGTKSDEQL